jgi:hypothetical protein
MGEQIVRIGKEFFNQCYFLRYFNPVGTPSCIIGELPLSHKPGACHYTNSNR